MKRKCFSVTEGDTSSLQTCHWVVSVPRTLILDSEVQTWKIGAIRWVYNKLEDKSVVRFCFKVWAKCFSVLLVSIICICCCLFKFILLKCYLYLVLVFFLKKTKQNIIHLKNSTDKACGHRYISIQTTVSNPIPIVPFRYLVSPLQSLLTKYPSHLRWYCFPHTRVL